MTITSLISLALTVGSQAQALLTADLKMEDHVIFVFIIINDFIGSKFISLLLISICSFKPLLWLDISYYLSPSFIKKRLSCYFSTERENLVMFLATKIFLLLFYSSRNITWGNYFHIIWGKYFSILFQLLFKQLMWPKILSVYVFMHVCV